LEHYFLSFRAGLSASELDQHSFVYSVEVQPGGKITTFLPYVEVIVGKKFGYLVNMWVDNDRIYLLNEPADMVSPFQLSRESDRLIFIQVWARTDLPEFKVVEI